MPCSPNIDSDKSMTELSALLAKTSDADLIYRFLNSLLTPYETGEISSRWELVKRINEGESQRNIAKELGLSLCKITRGSKELKKENSPFKDFISLLKKETN